MEQKRDCHPSLTNSPDNSKSHGYTPIMCYSSPGNAGSKGCSTYLGDIPVMADLSHWGGGRVAPTAEERHIGGS